MALVLALALAPAAAAALADARAAARAAGADAAAAPPPGPRIIRNPTGGDKDGPKDLLVPTSSGYLPAAKENGAKLFYLYFEADEPEGDLEETPILLWLQGGPGCASMFGVLYLNGPVYVQPDMSLEVNPGRWNRRYGTLYIDQPVGTGFSVRGTAPEPRDELTVAGHLYAALQEFYRARPAFSKRPLFLTGEARAANSYAGKYVPSAAHWILQAHAASHGYLDKLGKTRPMDPDIEAPLFPLGGLAVGNGFTDAIEQTRVQAEVAWSMGLIDTRQRIEAEGMQDQVIELVRNKQWTKARRLSDELLKFITDASASGTLEDVRRDEGYDAQDLTSQYLNMAAVKRAWGARDIPYVSCSPEVDASMGHDVMKSVANLVPDLLKFSHVLLYHGQFDAECGVASNEAWMSKLAWPGHAGFMSAERAIWRDSAGVPLGYRKQHKTLTHIIIRNAGHMVPHDRPEVSQAFMEDWVDSTRATPSAMDAAAAAAAAAAASGRAAAPAGAAAARREAGAGRISSS
ncbi:MAG: carboxypeptidase [Monoraphidium minutum]|nr:MAG: carboxypeptidase [Monoraphidium minutum]